MTAPATAAVYWLRTLGIGGILGIFYGFLRPLRPRFTIMSDLIFALATLWGWIYAVFAICGNDSRLSYTLALLMGIWATDATLGKWLSPVFSLFWKGIHRIFYLIFFPAGKLLQYFSKIYNFLLASGKKWVTIGGTITKAGGADHGKGKSHRQAGNPQNQPRRKGRSFGRRRVVRGGAGGPV
jgi:hypothetical protein